VVQLRTRQHVLDRRDEGRVSRDPELSVHGVTQLRKRAHAVLRAHVDDVGMDTLQLLAGQPGLEPVADSRDVETRVPDVDVPHVRELRHRLAVFADGRHHDRAARGLVEAAVPARDREARGESLHVPFERPGKRLVEVVDAEDEPSVRRGEDSEVGEVGVAAQLGE
jgi:hypothetical protein